MPKYRVQLKQGSRTIVNHIEAKSVPAVLAFFNYLSTMQVTEILKVEYTNDHIQPVDDMQYFPLVKFMARNENTRKTMQVVLHNIKLTRDSKEIDMAIREHLEIDGLKIDSTYTGLFKENKALTG